MLKARSRKAVQVALILLTFAAVAQPTFGQHAKVLVYFAPSLNASGPMQEPPMPTPSSPTSRAPISGVLRVLIIAAAFSDINYTTSINTIRKEYLETVAAYYKEISFGSVTIEGDVYGWYKLPYDEAHYGRDCMAIDDADCSGSDGSWQIAQDAVNLAQKDVNFNNYDYYVFVHSGNGQESSGVKDDVWSVTFLGGVYVPTKTKTLTKFNIVPEAEAAGAVPIGVYCHEFGHQLGLPDLYNTATGRTILGPWSLMDKGLWNGDPPGSSPAHMEAWSKIQLGFISGSMIAEAAPGVTSTFTIEPTEVASSNVLAVEVPLGTTTNPSQYYLIEVRTAVGFDAGLPATGVLITYIDDTALIGRVHIMDGHPDSLNLEDAVWNVGQTFSDGRNGLAVTVTGVVGDAYQVTVSRSGGPTSQPYIDLAITNINAQPQVITNPNTTVTITVQVSNLGTQAATNVFVEVELDGQPYTNTHINVAGGASTQTSFTWLSVLGSHVFRVIVDPDQLINDTNRANNVATFTLNVGSVLTINIPASVTSGGVWVLINDVNYNVTSSQLQVSVPDGPVTVQVQPAVNPSPGVRHLFSGWSDGSAQNPRQLTVTSDMSLSVQYKTQYHVQVSSATGFVRGDGWYDAGSQAVISAQTPFQISANQRAVLAGWSGIAADNQSTIRVTVDSPLQIEARWTTQYLVTVQSAYGTPEGAGWYDTGASARVTLSPEIDYGNETRQVFVQWHGKYTGNGATVTLTVDGPKTLTAEWATQYELVFHVDGLPEWADIVLSVHGKTYEVNSSKPLNAWLNRGDQINLINQTVPETFATILRFSKWQDSTRGSVDDPLAVTGPANYTIVYRRELTAGGFMTLVSIAVIAIGFVLHRRKHPQQTTRKRRRQSIPTATIIKDEPPPSNLLEFPDTTIPEQRTAEEKLEQWLRDDL